MIKAIILGASVANNVRVFDTLSTKVMGGCDLALFPRVRRYQGDSNPIPVKLESSRFQANLPVIDVGKNVKISRIAGKKMPPAMELRKGAKGSRGNDSKGLEVFAKFVVNYPEKESKKVPEE